MDKQNFPFSHRPVMAKEAVDGLRINPRGVYVDGTLGGGGHALYIARQLTAGRLIGIDRDGDAIDAASEKLRQYEKVFTAVRGNFTDTREILGLLRIPGIDGMLLDLGVSSYQLDEPSRGFSYMHDARLNMRMDDRSALDAYTVVNHYTEKRLTEIFFSYGEERYAKRIARAIISSRDVSPVETTFQLSEIITAAVPAKARYEQGHPAKRVFQAIRIEVNDELSRLDASLRDITRLLNPGGRLCVITFHSLEDRIVKRCFKNLADPCECPRDLPYCVCGKKPSLNLITRKALTPGEAELSLNRRAHSAKLRVAERTGNLE
ncbi:MAG: 16S rRNA (cytosine(1402)-N(4))-methyltransferase RsmH [Clostridiales bacterium]|jgi:16S rRNA (cytosine1402-N4)-methyltransferase|nr:16S rRNA (cytosine(1402)-N(4))-methyltransferase RsmH [Clostridiales bacterium]